MEPNHFGFENWLYQKKLETSHLGYEHSYKFRMDDEIIPRCEYTPSVGVKTFLFEMRTTFMLRTMEGVEETIGSETLNGSVKETDCIYDYLHFFLFERLTEYMLPIRGCRRFLLAARDCAFISVRPASDVIPVAVDFQVCTVQKPGEAVVASWDRAIRPEHLVPKYATSIAYERGAGMTAIFILYLKGLRPISAVEDADEGFKLMNECRLCMREPTVGAQISLLECCKHAFHWHCAVKWLEKHETCPTCGTKQHDYLSH